MTWCPGAGRIVISRRSDGRQAGRPDQVLVSRGPAAGATSTGMPVRWAMPEAGSTASGPLASSFTGTNENTDVFDVAKQVLTTP